MEQKICPFMSKSGAAAVCAAESCMLYRDEKGGCGALAGADRLAQRLDTLSAQVQEMQVALIEIMNSEKKQALGSDTLSAQVQEVQIILNLILNSQGSR